jgi:hypothetical protein
LINPGDIENFGDLLNANFSFTFGNGLTNNNNAASGCTDQPRLGFHVCGNSESVQQPDEMASARAAGGRISVSNLFRIEQHALE